MSATIRPERALGSPTTRSLDAVSSSELATNPTASVAGPSLAPTRPIASDGSRYANRDVSLLLALALAESTKELSRMQRESARTLLEGQIAILTGMIRLEPHVAAMLEDLRFLSTMATNAASLAAAGASAAKSSNTKVGKKLRATETKVKDALAMRVPDFGLRGKLGALAARSGAARFSSVRDHLVLHSPAARRLFARNAAAAQLEGRLADRPELRRAWLDVRTKAQEVQLYREASARRPSALDGADWGRPGGASSAWRTARLDAMAEARFGRRFAELPPRAQERIRPHVDRAQMLRDVYGDAPNPRQAALLDQATTLLRTNMDVYNGHLLRPSTLPTRGEFATALENHRPFGNYGERVFDNPDGARLVAAVREGRVDLSAPMRDVEGRLVRPGELTLGKALDAVQAHVRRELDDGLSKQQQELPGAIQGVSEVEQQILDAWYAKLMSARLELIQWSSRFGDVLADVTSVEMGVSDD